MILPALSFSTAVRVAAVGVLLAMIYTAWHNDREAYAAEKVAVLRNAYTIATAKDKAEKDQIGAERDAAVAKAQQDFAAYAAEKEAQLELQKSINADRAVIIARLRSSRAPDRSGPVGQDTGGACAAVSLRADRLEADLRQGQLLAIEGAGLVDEAATLVGECLALAREQSALIELAKADARAVRIRSQPTTKPEPGN
jgi:hypothetical protein